MAGAGAAQDRQNFVTREVPGGAEWRAMERFGP
jgi:hypothetical protein